MQYELQARKDVKVFIGESYPESKDQRHADAFNRFINIEIRKALQEFALWLDVKNTEAPDG